MYNFNYCNTVHGKTSLIYRINTFVEMFAKMELSRPKKKTKN